MSAAAPLDRLRQRQPEWGPWLAVVDEVLREASARTWEAWVPDRLEAPAPGVPLLAGAVLAVPPNAVRRLLERLARIARRGGTEKMATLAAVIEKSRDPAIDAMTLFTASVLQDSDRVQELAEDAGVDPEALHAVGGLLPVPFLQACHRRWARAVPESWVEGYCPICAAWPALVEVRGIERSRCFRCGRCGAEWHARLLHCPYCDMTDHEALVTLTPEAGGSRGVIEACTRCRGYVKAFTTLQGSPPGSVLLDDLGSVDLDVAALQEGYMRPLGRAAEAAAPLR